MYYNFAPALAGFSLLFAVLSNSAMAGPKLDDATILAIFDQANSVDIYTGRCWSVDFVMSVTPG